MQHQPCSMYRTQTPAENPKPSSFFHRDSSEKETAMDGTRPKSSPSAWHASRPLLLPGKFPPLSGLGPLRLGDNKEAEPATVTDRRGLRGVLFATFERHTRWRGKSYPPQTSRQRASRHPKLHRTLFRTDRRALFPPHRSGRVKRACFLHSSRDRDIFFRVNVFPFAEPPLDRDEGVRFETTVKRYTVWHRRHGFRHSPCDDYRQNKSPNVPNLLRTVS